MSTEDVAILCLECQQYHVQGNGMTDLVTLCGQAVTWPKTASI